MRCLLLVAVMVGLVAGCGEESAEVQEERAEVYAEPAWRWLPADDGEMTGGEVRALEAVRVLVEAKRQPNWAVSDYQYEVTRDGETYRVFLQRVVSYREGEPMMVPGGHSLYVMDLEGGLIRFVPGR